MRFGTKCPKGFLPVYSVDTEEEAKSLIVLTCPTDNDGNYYSPELFQQRVARRRERTRESAEEDLAILDAFGERLHAAYQMMKSTAAQRSAK